MIPLTSQLALASDAAPQLFVGREAKQPLPPNPTPAEGEEQP